MKPMPDFVVFPASVPVWRYADEIDRWGNGLGTKARGFYDAKDAEKHARRSGVGASVCECVAGFPVVARIVKPSAFRKGVVTEVTWEGGRYL